MKILHQEKRFAVVEKPEGLPVNKNSHMPHDADYLNKQAAAIFGQNIYNPHRLDAKTSGLIILCFDKEITEAFNALFRQKAIKKTYLAVTKGQVPLSGKIDSPVFDRKKRKKQAAETTYKRIDQVSTGQKDKNDQDLYLNLLEIDIQTGRWHQIRQHLSSLRYDIIGDTQHGDWTLNKKITAEHGFHRLFLHALELEFRHPLNGKDLHLSSTVPDTFNKLLQFYKS
ncbi:MAG TPA: pseudouridine synthase [Bacteroidales bacterium]|nr:pseudouridine synthase [Bacteroidales bacterium]